MPGPHRAGPLGSGHPCVFPVPSWRLAQSRASGHVGMGAGHARHGGGRLVVGTAGLPTGCRQLKWGCAHLDSGRVPPVCCPESPEGTTLRPLPNPPAPQCAFSQEFRLCSVSCSSAQGLTLRSCLSLGQRGWGHTAHGSTQPSWAPRTPHGRQGVLVQSSQ